MRTCAQLVVQREGGLETVNGLDRRCCRREEVQLVAEAWTDVQYKTVRFGEDWSKNVYMGFILGTRGT